MSNFNTIFTIVQDHCKEQGSILGDDEFDKIAAEVGIPLERLHFYLDCLQQTGVIRYVPENKSIAMTEKGTKAIRIFP